MIADYSRCPGAPDVAPEFLHRNWWCERATWCIMWRVSLAPHATPRWTKAIISANETDWCIVGEKQECLIITILQRPSLLVINEFDDEVDRSTRRFVAPSHSLLYIPYRRANDGCWVLMIVIGTDGFGLGFWEDYRDDRYREAWEWVFMNVKI